MDLEDRQSLLGALTGMLALALAALASFLSVFTYVIMVREKTSHFSVG